MKKLKTILPATLFLLTGTAFSQYKSSQGNHDSAIHISSNSGGISLWGEFNAGYSNNGAMGNATLNFRKGNSYFGASYYKSHTCYKDSIQHEHFLEISVLNVLPA